jgi:hypothetical protein
MSERADILRVRFDLRLHQCKRFAYICRLVNPAALNPVLGVSLLQCRPEPHRAVRCPAGAFKACDHLRNAEELSIAQSRQDELSTSKTASSTFALSFGSGGRASTTSVKGRVKVSQRATQNIATLGWYYYSIGVRQHPGCRAYHRAGGFHDALAHEGQTLATLVWDYALSWRALLWPPPSAYPPPSVPIALAHRQVALPGEVAHGLRQRLDPIDQLSADPRLHPIAPQTGSGRPRSDRDVPDCCRPFRDPISTHSGTAGMLGGWPATRTAVARARTRARMAQ